MICAKAEIKSYLGQLQWLVHMFPNSQPCVPCLKQNSFIKYHTTTYHEQVIYDHTENKWNNITRFTNMSH